MTTLEALKNLAVTLGCAEKMTDVKGDSVAEVIQFIADNYTRAETEAETEAED